METTCQTMKYLKVIGYLLAPDHMPIPEPQSSHPDADPLTQSLEELTLSQVSPSTCDLSDRKELLAQSRKEGGVGPMVLNSPSTGIQMDIVQLPSELDQQVLSLMPHFLIPFQKVLSISLKRRGGEMQSFGKPCLLWVFWGLQNQTEVVPHSPLPRAQATVLFPLVLSPDAQDCMVQFAPLIPLP